MWTKKLLHLALIIRMIFLFWSNLSLYTQPLDIKLLEDKYFKSSYILGDKADIVLSDADLYAVEGNMLVSQAKDLEKLTPGHPPLGKYIIGLSQKMFNNPHLFQLLSFVAVISLFYLVSGSALLTLVFSFEPLLVDQLRQTLLDIHLLAFQLTAIYFFLSFMKKKTPSLLLASLSWFFLGLSFATKFFPVSLPLTTTLILYTVLSKDFKKFSKFILALPSAGVSFLLGHLTYFAYHPSIVSFVKYIRYQINWWAGSPQVNPFSIFKIIFQNKWPTWWGDGMIKVKQWWIGWPVLTSLSLLHRQDKFLFLYLIISFIFLSFQAVFPRHLLPVLPIIYILAYGTINKLWQKCLQVFSGTY